MPSTPRPSSALRPNKSQPRRRWAMPASRSEASNAPAAETMPNAPASAASAPNTSCTKPGSIG